MSEDAKKISDELGKVVAEIRETQKNWEASGDSVARANLDVMQTKAVDLEEKMQSLAAKQKADEEEKKNLEDRINTLEGELSRKGTGSSSVSYKEGSEYKALIGFLKKNPENIMPHDVKDLRTDSQISGGYLVPEEMHDEIVKKITEITPFISAARILTIGTKSLSVPKRGSLVGAYWEGELQQTSKSQSTYEMTNIESKKLMVQVACSNEASEDSAFDMGQEIINDVSEAFAKAIGRAFVVGEGPNQPNGFLTNTEISSINSGNASEITVDSLIKVTGELKTGYVGSYMLNRRTWADLLTKKDNQGEYLIHPTLAVSAPGTLMGFQYFVAEDMPDVAANSTPVAFGDWRRAYYVVQRVGMTMIRDNFTLAGQDAFVITARQRIGGSVVLPEAIKLIKVAA